MSSCDYFHDYTKFCFIAYHVISRQQIYIDGNSIEKAIVCGFNPSQPGVRLQTVFLTYIISILYISQNVTNYSRAIRFVSKMYITQIFKQCQL